MRKNLDKGNPDYEMETIRDKKRISPRQDKEPETRANHGTCPLLEKEAKINGKKVRILIDPGATTNFISEKTVRRIKIKTAEKRNPYTLKAFDDKTVAYNGGWVDTETENTELLIGTHEETISLDISDLGEHEIILGRPWMNFHNPEIDWKAETLEFS
jgi:hypothetical protein